MSANGHIFCLFSNLWFYTGSGDHNKDTENITKIKQVHGINKCINLDAKTGFWSETIAKYQQYDPTIVAQLRLHNSTQLLDVYKTLSNMISTLILKPSTFTSSGTSKDHMVLIYTINVNNIECLFGLYLYYLCKITGANITTAIEILKTKIQIATLGGQRTIINFTDDMKKLLYLQCESRK